MQKHDFASLPKLSIQMQEVRNIPFALAILTDHNSLALLIMICFTVRIYVGSEIIQNDNRAMHVNLYLLLNTLSGRPYH